MAAALLLALLLQFREGREPFGGLHSTRKKQHVPREQDAPFQLAVARRLNAALLDVTASREVHSLRGALAATSVRYIGVVETRPASSKVHALDGVHFVARMTGTRETAGHAVIAEKYRTVSFRPGETTFTLIGTDEATGANGDIAYGNGEYVMIGGGSDAGGKHWPGVRFVEHFAGKLRPRELILATVDVLPAVTDWRRVLAGAWLSRWTVDARNTSAPARLASGWTAAMPEYNHSGCLDATHAPGCDQDGRFSLVRSRGRWLLFGRANALVHGGRTVQVAASVGVDARGPYGAFEQLRWAGFEPMAQAEGGRALLRRNVYFAAVRAHPEDEGVLVGLFPVNEGEKDTPNGNIGGFVGLALSCDGVEWTTPQPLVWCGGLAGRTDDHPVVGGLHLDAERRLHFYLQHAVPGIAADASEEGHVRRHALRPGVLDALVADARGTLRACAGPALGPPDLAPPLAVAREDAADARAPAPAPPERAGLGCLACRARRCSAAVWAEAAGDGVAAPFPSCACAVCGAACAADWGCDGAPTSRCTAGSMPLEADGRVRVGCGSAESASWRTLWRAERAAKGRAIVRFADEQTAPGRVVEPDAAELARERDAARREAAALEAALGWLGGGGAAAGAVGALLALGRVAWRRAQRRGHTGRRAARSRTDDARDGGADDDAQGLLEDVRAANRE